ncbi:hypothetical protein DF185_08365 [Marinifilum breve]|uniref:Uncharacterized protein n=1 Tax=Marinifilum breve TaxID=2184082 RepID=A0A2V3ZYJ7_9BACT|nr:hypothetical protein [Marinifilum breve]PXY01488.1 hypothetical protein DF185_08365 [Marinifilum breve]
MEERSAFDILVDYPKKHGLDYDTHTNDRRFHFFPSDPVLNTKFVIFKKDNLFFCAYDSFGTKAYMNCTYTGLYGLIDIPDPLELKMTKKDWLDKFLTSNKRKTGNHYIDENVTISSKSSDIPMRVVNEKAVKHFLKITEKMNPLKVIIENDYLQFVKELKGKMVVGVEINKWLFEESDVDYFLEHGSKLLHSMQRKKDILHKM